MAAGTSYRMPAALPAPASGFVGRAAELGGARRLLRRARTERPAGLVTITGPGGVGKTRLAFRVADEAAGEFRDGVRLVELSALRDPGLLVHAVEAGLGLAEPPVSVSVADREARLASLLGYLRDRELLLVFDTCEHLVDGCAALADTLLREAPGVTILATSRQPLGTAGEAVLRLYPLPVPAPGSATAGTADAVELFAQRAAAAVPGFTVTPENLADVITICQRLDGIPLAIELATVRLRALPLRQMAEGIDDRLRLLTGGRRAGAPRHQTLRAAIEWSYSLCTPAEQLLWARLSVFAGGFDIAAAEEVCAGGALPAGDIAPAIAGLARKSVLVSAGTPEGGPGSGTPHSGDPDSAALDSAALDWGGPAAHKIIPERGRPAGAVFRMLDTLREFGAERLHEAGRQVIAPRGQAAGRTRRQGAGPGRAAGPGPAEAAVRRRFIARYLALAERFEREPATDQLGQYRRLREEHANLRAAFDYALGLPGDEGAAIVLATSLFVYWRISGLLREAEYWLDQALERCPKRSAVRARVLSTRGHIRVLIGDFANGSADAAAAAELADAFGDPAAGGRAHGTLHRALIFSGDSAAAQRAADAAAACLTSTGDVLARAQLGAVEAMFCLQAGEPRRCCEVTARALELLPDGEIWCSAHLLGLQAMGLFLCGDLAAAQRPAHLSLAMKSELQDVTGIAFGLCGLGFLAAGAGRATRTAWLFGAAAPLWERVGRWYTSSPAFERLHQVAERAARARLGDDRYWQAYAAGAAAPAGLAVERALSDADELAG